MTAEGEMWEEACRREHDRVKELELTAASQGKISSAKFQAPAKPWSWSAAGPGALFDLDDRMITVVHSLDYDLDAKRFVSFLDRKAQLHLCRQQDSPYWEMLQRKFVSRDEFVSNPSIQYAQEFKGECYRYSEEELKGFWRIFLRTRVYLQGAYDTFLHRKTKEPDQAKFGSKRDQ